MELDGTTALEPFAATGPSGLDPMDLKVADIGNKVPGASIYAYNPL